MAATSSIVAIRIRHILEERRNVALIAATEEVLKERKCIILIAASPAIHTSSSIALIHRNIAVHAVVVVPRIDIASTISSPAAYWTAVVAVVVISTTATSSLVVVAISIVITVHFHEFL